MKKYIFSVFAISILFLPLSLFGSVLFDSSDTGTPYNVSSYIFVNNLYMRLPFSTSTFQFPTDVSYTLTSPISTLRFKKLSGVDCSVPVNINIFTDEGNSLGIVQAGAANDNFCDFPVINTTIGQKFGALGICVSNTCDNSLGDFVLDGSPTNIGFSFDGYGQNPTPGGVAFQLCDDGGCSGGFNNPPATTTETLKPVIIIPGIMGSAYKNGNWTIDPIFHVYDNLIETLVANGYSTTSTLFTFPYDWKNSNSDSAILLKQKINQVKEICNCSQVDIVAHSMGGLVARAYAQSPDYDNDIDHLIFLGTPHKGAPKDYLTWEAGEFAPGLRENFVRSHFKKEAKAFGYNSLFDYIHGWPVTSVNELLPTYDYLKSSTTTNLLTYPSGYPENNFLVNLNQGQGALLTSDIDITNIVGNTGSNTISLIRITNSGLIPLWQHGYPENFSSFLSDRGLEYGLGDGTVPEYSSKFGNITDLEIVSSHLNLPTDAEEEIYQKLTGENVGQTIKKSIPIKILFTKIFSPADFVIIAPDGKRVGKDFVTGQEVNEIEGAFYSGFDTDDEYVTIPDPIDGEYKVETMGTDNGGEYTIIASNISDNGASDSSFTGQTLLGLQTSVSFSIDSATTTLEITPDDKISPIVAIASPLVGEYDRSQTITILATSTDDVGVSTSTLSFSNRLVTNPTNIDLFFEKLGTTTILATAMDFQNNFATSTLDIRIVATASSTVSDINRAYSLGWITKKSIRDELIQKLQKVLKAQKRIENIVEKINGKNTTRKVERIEIVIDKTLGRALLVDLKGYTKDKINEKGYNLIKEDLEWLISNHSL